MISKENIEELKAALLKEKKEIESSLKPLEDHWMGDDVDHGEEKSDEVEEIFDRAGELTALKRRLESLNEALTKIEAGRFGLCEKCGEEISLDLLKIDPDSMFCKDCKAKTEG